MKVFGALLSVVSVVYSQDADVETWEECNFKNNCKSSRDHCCPASPPTNSTLPVDLKGVTLKLCGSSSSKYDAFKVPTSSKKYAGYNWYVCKSVAGANVLSVATISGIAAALYQIA